MHSDILRIRAHIASSIAPLPIVVAAAATVTTSISAVQQSLQDSSQQERRTALTSHQMSSSSSSSVAQTAPATTDDRLGTIITPSLTAEEVAQATFGLSNDIEAITADEIFRYDAEMQKTILAQQPWKTDNHYFKKVRISAVALIKMVRSSLGLFPSSSSCWHCDRS